MKFRFSLIQLALVLWFYAQALGVEKTLNVEAGIDYVTGNSTYSIGYEVTLPDGTSGYIPWTISELKFPLNTLWAFANFGLNISDAISFHAYINKNIIPESGKMEDSDWIYSPLIKDVFSLSDTKLNGIMIDIDFQYRPFNFLNIISFGFGLGFIYNGFDFEAGNTDQWNPSDPSEPHWTTNVTTITYSVKYYMPYIEIVSKAKFLDNINVSLAIGFSPYSFGNDIDDHIIRSKKSEGNGDGTGWKVLANAQYFILQNLYINLYLKYINISLSGRSKQTRYADTSEGPAGPIATIDEKISTDYGIIGLSLGYSF